MTSDEGNALDLEQAPPETAPMADDSDIQVSQMDVEQYIRRLSCCHAKEDDESASIHRSNVDHSLLLNVLSQAGEFAFGIAAVEVYVFEDPRLVPVQGCWFRPGSMISQHVGNDESEQDIITHPEICIPGIDLVGALWQHSTPGDMKRTSSFSSLGGPSWTKSFRQKQQTDETQNVLQQPFGCVVLQWRDLQSVIDDPDAIHGPRLEALRNCGLESAAGVGFDVHGTRGMVVYYSQTGADPKMLSAVVSETYLRRTASMIGSLLAMAEARQASVAFRRQQQQLARPWQDDNFKEDLGNTRPTITRLGRIGNQFLVWYEKMWGGGSQIPPGMPLVETLWTILGVFVGLLTVSSCSELFQFVSEEEYFLIMGPFGALVTLQYGLTGAPAAQPRNIVWGHVVAGAISLASTYIPDSVIAPFLRQLLAPAFAIGTMVKLGVTHPPAGAFSVIFSQGNHNWGFYGLAVLCSIVSIIPATLVNNMSQKRQYPTYWGCGPPYVSRLVRGRRKQNFTEESQGR